MTTTTIRQAIDIAPPDLIPAVVIAWIATELLFGRPRDKK